MFTGLIKEVGTIKKITPNAEGVELFISSPKLAPEIQIDDSVATNGICLTATAVTPDGFKAQAVHVTKEKTSLKFWKTGEKVNLELALRLSDRLGGHIVQGHINGLGKISAMTKKGENYVLGITLEQALLKYCIKEGSIALDGISLTIADMSEHQVFVSLIPHTWNQTNMHTKKIGDALNIEVDIMAKYIEKLIGINHSTSKQQHLTELLAQWD